MKSNFEIDLGAIRTRAREQMNQGAVTAAYTADRKRVIEVLNEALATEIVCVLRYKNHYFMARGIRGETVAKEFLQHAAEEQQHADLIAGRIAQLGGTPNFNPEVLSTLSHSQYREGENLKQMIGEDLIAERIAIETYSAIVRWLGASDSTSRRMMEQILEKEEEHADDLARLLEDF
jgi:bacterioferritin